MRGVMDFFTLYDQHHQKVRKFILTITNDEWVADDLIQETFIRVKKNMNNIREAERTSSWIFKIAYHLCMDHIKKNKKHTAIGSELRDIPLKTPLLKQIEQQQMGACIQEKMNKLPDAMKTIINLYDIMEFTHKEISDILSITEENSKVKLHRARKKLKAILNKECSLKYDERNVFMCEPIQQQQSIGN